MVDLKGTRPQGLSPAADVVSALTVDLLVTMLAFLNAVERPY
jgi:hypothetical protein